MSNESWTPTIKAFPPKDAKVEWITPSGEHVRGTYAGGVIWFPEGSSMYVYYQPTYWRLLK